jgi:MFS family permease
MEINALDRRHALRFVILLGIVSLFADVTYEGARSITGPFLAILGASAAVVGFVSGLGELVGYALRLVSGYFADRTQKYWTITIIGYVINLLAVPFLAIVHHWSAAAVLIIAERLGKAIRTPARDAMLSHAGEHLGMGWGFGIHEALDQIGAMCGPLTVALVLYVTGDSNYRLGFAILAIPAVMAILTLLFAKKMYPNPHHLSSKRITLHSEGIPRIFWFYWVGALFVAAGFADFPLVAYHFEKKNLLTPAWIPLAYAIAMGVDGGMALWLGRLYDRYGFWVLIIVTFVAALFAPLVFLGNFYLALLGVILWAIGMGAHESLMRAVVGKMVGDTKRASAYGIFNMGYGVAWFLGSALMGVIYDISIVFVVVFILVLQLAALPWLILVARRL